MGPDVDAFETLPFSSTLVRCKSRRYSYTRTVLQVTSAPLRILARPKYSSLKANPYTTLIYQQVTQAGIHVVEYNSMRAALGSWDVIHVHWPESVFDHTLAEALLTTESLLFSVRNARRRGTKLLWTIHNLRAHEYKYPQLEERFWQRFIAELDAVVALTTPGLLAARTRFSGLANVPAWIVPHPHYRGQYPDTLDRAAARKRLNIKHDAKVMLVFGRMYEYKNVPALIGAVRDAPDREWVVLVAGKPRNTAIAQELRALGSRDARIRYFLEYIPPNDVQVFFRAADLVVEPYREILNSGTALLALSFDRPVLIPHRGAGIDLINDFGSPWVHTFEGTLTPDKLGRTLCEIAGLPERTAGKHVDCIDASRVGDKMVDVYRQLVGR